MIISIKVFGQPGPSLSFLRDLARTIKANWPEAEIVDDPTFEAQRDLHHKHGGVITGRLFAWDRE